MNDYFDPYNFDYKSYITEMYNLTEMPARLPHNTSFQMDDYATNSYEGVRIEKNDKFVKMFYRDFYRVFHNEENGIDTFYLLNKEQPYICAEHSFKQIITPIKGMENLHVWNSRYHRGLIRLWFKDEIIPKENVIISDKIQSDSGFNFWISLFDDYVSSNKSHDMLIIDYKEGNIIKNITKKEEMKDFYGDNKFNHRFMLKKHDYNNLK